MISSCTSCGIQHWSPFSQARHKITDSWVFPVKQAKSPPIASPCQWALRNTFQNKKHSQTRTDAHLQRTFSSPASHGENLPAAQFYSNSYQTEYNMIRLKADTFAVNKGKPTTILLRIKICTLIKIRSEPHKSVGKLWLNHWSEHIHCLHYKRRPLIPIQRTKKKERRKLVSFW